MLIFEFLRYRMRTLRIAYESAAKLGQYEDALMYGKRLLEIYQHFLAPFDPWLLILMKNLTKISLNAKNSAETKNFVKIFKPKLTAISRNSAPIFNDCFELCERAEKIK